MKPHADRDRLIERVAALKSVAVAFAGVMLRSTTPKYATEMDLITGGGSRKCGGRWNPIGIAAVYGSLTPEVAMAETLAVCHYYGLPAEAAMPRTFVAIEVRLRRVLDLTDGTVRRRLGVSIRRILETDWRQENDAGREALTQAIGLAAAGAGLEAIRVVSAQVQNGENLIVFPAGLHKTSQLRVRKADEL